MPFALLLSAALLEGCAGAVNDAARPKTDAFCVEALAHVSQCDPRFPDRTVLCAYGASGQCAPYLNAEQAQCMHDAPCEVVRAALDRRDWLCGVSLAPSMTPVVHPSP